MADNLARKPDPEDGDPDLRLVDPNAALADTDYSQAVDYSAGSPSSNYLSLVPPATDTSSRLKVLEGGKNPGQQHENDITNYNNLTKRENTANSGSATNQTGVDKKSNPFNYSNKNNGQSPLANMRAKIKSKVARRVATGALVAILGIGGIGLGMSLPQIMAGKIMDVLEKRFVAATANVTSSHVKNLWKCKLSSKCSTAVKDTTGDDSKTSLGGTSDAAKESINKNGGDITETTDTTDGKIKLTDSETIGSSDDKANGVTGIDDMPAATEADFEKSSPAGNGEYSATGSETMRATGYIFGINKNIPVNKRVGDNVDGSSKTIEEQLDAQTNRESDSTDLTVDEAKTVSQKNDVNFIKNSSSSSGSEDEDKSNNKTGFEEPSRSDIKVESSSSILSKAKSKISSLADKIKTSGGDAAVAALNMACDITSGASGAIKAYDLGVKLYKMQSLVRFAFTFMTVFDAIRADDGSGLTGHTGPTSEQFTQLMNQLFTVKYDSNGNAKSKSGTDSFGYQVANGDLAPSSSSNNKFSLTNNTSDTAVGAPTSFTSTVITNSDTGGNDLLTTIMNEAVGTVGALSQSSIMNTIVSKGCTAVSDILATADMASGAGSLASVLTGAGAGVVALEGLSGILGGIAQWTGNNTLSDIAAATSVASYCADVVPSGGLSIAKCLLSVASVVVMAKIGYIVGLVVNKLTDSFLINPMPVGSDAMDAIVSGTGASMGTNAALNAVPVAASTDTAAGTTSYLKLESERIAYNKEQDAISRATDSPFDIYNNATFLGSIMGNFAASLYSNGNSPLGFAQSLLGMFGSSLSGVIKGSSAYAADSDAASVAYASSCTDSDIVSASIAADPFCNPIYGLSNDDTLSLEDTVDRITATGWGDCVVGGSINTDISDQSTCENTKDSDGKAGTWHSAIDASAPNYDKSYGLNTDAVIPGTATGFGGSSKTIGDWLNVCVTRNKSGSFTPMGTADSDSNMDNGKNCAISDDSAYGRENLITLYNYAEYFLANSNINQGSSLGSQADGSATN